MNKTLNIPSSNLKFKKIKEKQKEREREREINIGRCRLEKTYRPSSTSTKIKQDKNKKIRLLSAGNINPKQLNKKSNTTKNYFNFPSLNSKNNIILSSKKVKQMNNSADKKNELKMELERIYEQNNQYKKTIKYLQAQIYSIKRDTEQKEFILNSKREEINSILKNNKYNEEICCAHFSDSSKLSLVKKIKKQIKKSEQELNENMSKYIELRKNIKHTRKHEIMIEKEIYDNHLNKILVLIENSNKYKNQKDSAMVQNEFLSTYLDEQQKIIKTIVNQYNELEKEEDFLKNEIIKHENNLNKTKNKLKIIRLNNISLKELNLKFKKEQKRFINKNGKDEYSLEKYNKELTKAKNNYLYNKLKNAKTLEKLSNIKKQYNTSFEQYKSINEKDILKNNLKNIPIQNSNITEDFIKKKKIYTEEYINKLKMIYQENREKETELEQGLFLYQSAVKSLNNGENINISEIKETIMNNLNNTTKSNIEYFSANNNI